MVDNTLAPSLSTDKPLASRNWPSTSLPHITDEVIPPGHGHRTLVLCFDGTGDQFDADVSCFGCSHPFAL